MLRRILSIYPVVICGALGLLNAGTPSSFAQTVGLTATAQNISQTRYADQYNWSQKESGTLSAGVNTITLTSCPAGVYGVVTANGIADQLQTPWVYIQSANGDTNPNEAAPIIGGTANGRSQPSCTIVVPTAFSHAAGYTIGSASGGFVEAALDCLSPNCVIRAQSSVVYNGVQQNNAATDLTIYATATIFPNYKFELDGTGVEVVCKVYATCFMLGQNTSQLNSDEGLVQNFRVVPGALNNAGTSIAPSSPSTVGCTNPCTNGQAIPISTISGNGTTTTVTVFSGFGTLASMGFATNDTPLLYMVPSSTFWNYTTPSITVTGNTTFTFSSGFNGTLNLSGYGYVTKPVTLTMASMPAASVLPFYAAIPGQQIWIAGTHSGMPQTPFNLAGGEWVWVTGGTCVPSATNCTIKVADATPGYSAGLRQHDAGYTLTWAVNPAFEDNTGGVTFSNIQVTTNGSAFFGSVIRNDNDQAEVVDTFGGHGVTGAWGNQWFTGSAIFAIGGNGNQGITKVRDANMSAVNGENCASFFGEKFTWNGGVCQDAASVGIYLNGLRGAGPGSRYAIQDVWFEGSGAVHNPVGNIGTTGISADIGTSLDVYGNTSLGANLAAVGTGNGGNFPQFSVNGSPGTANVQYYWVVARNGTTPTLFSTPLYAGCAVDTTVNSTTSVNVNWPALPPAGQVTAGNISGYDLLRVTVAGSSCNGNQVILPTSASNIAVFTGSTPASLCGITGLCSFTDTVTSPSSYTVDFGGNGTDFYPDIIQWPGSVVMSGEGTNGGNSAGSYFGQMGCFVTNVKPFELVQNISTFGLEATTNLGNFCPMSTSPVYVPHTSLSENLGFNQGTGVFLLDSNGVQTSNVKGVLNFGPASRVNAVAHDQITFQDTTFATTVQQSNTGGTGGNGIYRPPSSTGDCAIGTAGGSDLTFRCGTSITMQVNALAGAASPLAKVTSTGLALGGHLNQSATANFAGKCSMSASTSCTITITSSYTSTPGCIATVQGTTAIAGACSVSGTTVTITAASSNSATWAAMLFGNPN